MGDSCVCNRQVLTETGTHRQEIKWPPEGWPSGRERASCRLAKGPWFSPQGPEEIPNEFVAERGVVCTLFLKPSAKIGLGTGFSMSGKLGH